MKTQGTQESYELYGATAESVINPIASDISTIRHQDEDDMIMEEERLLLKDGSTNFLGKQKF